MRSSEVERLLRHLEVVRQRHPVATLVAEGGSTYSGDITYFSPTEIVVSEPVTRQSSKLPLETAVSVRVIALGHPAETFGANLDDDETVIP
jgi:hypothetical protein